MDTRISGLIDWCRRHIAVVVLLGLGIVLLIILSQYSILSISVNAPDNTEYDTTLLAENIAVKPLRNGINFVKHGEYSVRSESSNSSTEHYLKLGLLSYKSIAITLEPQKNLTKVASKSLGCIYGNAPLASATETFSYTCESADRILRHAFSDRPLVSQHFTRRVYAIKPYGSGVLGYITGTGQDDKLQLVYIANGKPELLPHTISAEAANSEISIHVLGTQKNSTSSPFVIADRSKKELWFFRARNDTSPTKISVSSMSSNEQFAVAGDTLFSLSPGGAPARTEEDIESFNGGTLRTYTNSGSALSADKTITVPDDIDLFSMLALDGTHLAVTGLDRVMRIYEVRGDSIAGSDRIHGVDASVSFDGGVAFRRSNDIMFYSAAARSSKLLHRLNYVAPTFMQNNNGTLVLSGVQGSGEAHYSFVLDPSTDRKDGLERVIGYSGQIGQLRFIDYFGTTIYAEFNLKSITTNRKTGTFTYDESELAKLRTALTDRMKADGLEPSRYKVVTN